MSEREAGRAAERPDPTRPDAADPDALRIDDGPAKVEGDALRDGSGSRQGEAPSASRKPPTS